jgi:hypothetical protein
VDFTGPIMRRLGLTPAECRRRVMLRRSLRGAAAATALIGLAAGIHLHNLRVAATLPGGPTIPAAVRNDLRLHGKTVTATVRSIRRLTPWQPEPDSVNDEPEPAADGEPGPTERPSPDQV